MELRPHRQPGRHRARYPYNYEMGLHFDKIDVGYPGVTTNEKITEANARAFYTKWNFMMDA